jgi:uncharacterized membrane protein AbrB (regulator of aidB expression)
VAACAALGALLARLTGATPLEGYLATTPGGIYAVLATAISSGSTWRSSSRCRCSGSS